MRELTNIFFTFHTVFRAASTYRSIQAVCYNIPHVCILRTVYQNLHKATQNDPLCFTETSSIPSILLCLKNLKTSGPCNKKSYTLHATYITISRSTRSKKKKKKMAEKWRCTLTFWRRTFFQILAHPVFKMCVIQKPNKVAL